MSSNTGAVTDYIEPMDDLLLAIRAKIKAYCGQGTRYEYHVFRYHGTSMSGLLQQIPNLRLPALVIWYGGSTYQDNPRREAEIHITAIRHAENLLADATESAISMIERAMAVLDTQLLLGDSVMFAQNDDPVEIPNEPHMIVVDSVYNLKDH